VTPRELRTAQLKDKEFRGVDYFLNNISTKELAILCVQMQRLFPSTEISGGIHSRRRHLFQEEMQFLQKIFLRLDDPDSVDGVTAARGKRLPSRAYYSFTRPWVRSGGDAVLRPKRSSIPPDFSLQQRYLQNR